MIYSNACSYAIRAMSLLTIANPSGFVLLSDLCNEDEQLPRHFIAKICQELVRKKLLVSSKGRGGGFALARAPEQIALYDIVTAVDGARELDDCVLGLKHCDDKQPCPQHEMWKPLRSQLTKFLKETTLQSMAASLSAKIPQHANPRPRSHA